MKQDKITNILIIILIILVAYLTYLQLSEASSIDRRINEAVKSIQTQKVSPVIQPINGYTPQKNIDYFDGVSIKGEKGDSVKGDKGDKGDSIKGDRGEKGDAGNNGLTPTFQCNVARNRWEVKYGNDETWSVVGETPVKCTIKLQDILEELFKYNNGIIRI